MKDQIYPQEHYIELKGMQDFLVGRIALIKQGLNFTVEIDIVQNESGKIHNHVGIFYGEQDAREALDMGVHQLKKYLSSKLV